MSSTNKRFCGKFLLLVSVFFICFIANSQDSTQLFKKEKYRWIHTCGISMNNGIYFPEKIYDNYGLVTRVLRPRYGYEFDVNYSPIIYKGFGMNIDVILFGAIPNGYELSANKKIRSDTVWANGFKGDPLDGAVNYSTALPFLGLNILFNYTFHPVKHLALQPAVGVKLPFMPRYDIKNSASFGDTNLTNSVVYLSSAANNWENKRVFFPDFLVRLDCLIYPKNPMHCIRVGLNFNYGFVPRLEGYYAVRNLGAKYDSGGRVKYGSTHFGITVGYQFVSAKDWNKKSALPTENHYLFNPHF